MALALSEACVSSVGDGQPGFTRSVLHARRLRQRDVERRATPDERRFRSGTYIAFAEWSRSRDGFNM